jgi:hypothetical protein
LNLLPGKAHPVDRAGSVIFHHHVALFDEPGKDFLARFGLGIQRHAELIGVQHGEVQAVGARNVAQLAARRIAFAGLLNFDDVRAKPRENLGAGRT